MKPTIGRIVLFRISRDARRPMIITNVNDDGTVNGVVFLDPPRDETAIGDRKSYVAVEFAAEGTGPSTWQWPPRV